MATRKSSLGGGTSPPEEAFPLPQHGLFADFDAGVGAVLLCDDFRSLSCARKLVILDDWRRGIDAERERALVGHFHEVTAAIAAAPLPDKIARFRAACIEEGIPCPPDLALLLQQF